MRRTGHFFSLLVSLIAFMAIGCTFADNHNLLEEKTFTVTKGGKLRIEAPGSDIKVQGCASSEVKLHIYGHDQDKKYYEVEYSTENNEVYIRVKKRGSSWSNLFHNNNGGLVLQLDVPSEFDLNLETAGGDVKVANVKGTSRLQSAGGDIKVDHCGGQCTASTAGGDVIISRFDGAMKCTTAGGDVKCYGITGDLNAQSSGGDIVLDCKNGKVSASTTGGDIKATYYGENKGIHLASTGGDIALGLENSIKANVYLISSGGDIDFDMPTSKVHKFSSKKFEGELNGGGPEVKVTTSGGDVRVISIH
ncbi:MAG: DUF4097 domain-containing protein [Ignavibacteria bacterium]|nr:DUF4097 domain-containing protein [Ignavibacteria bacterium]